MPKIYKAKWILPGNGQVIEDGAVLVENGKILDIVTEIGQYSAFETADYGNAVVTPGFINLHTHLQYTFKINQSIINRIKKFVASHILKLIGRLPDKSDDDFINWIIGLAKEYFSFNSERRIEIFKNGLKEALLSGTTCLAQLSKEDEYFYILNNSSIKSYIFFEIFANSEEMSEKEFIKLIKKLDKFNQEKTDSTYLGISPHSIYNVHPYLWKKIAEYSKEEEILIHTHLAESEAEMKWLEKGCSDVNFIHKFAGWENLYPYETGLNPVQYLAKLDVLNENLILAHLNQLGESEFEELAKYKVNIAHCPRSNNILHGKTLDLNKIIKYFPEGIGIGTDSKASNYDINILHEAKFIRSSTGLDVLKILDMLTIDAAKILKLDQKIGSLEKEKDADFLVFRLQENESYPDILSKDAPNEIYITGKQVVKDKKLLSGVI